MLLCVDDDDDDDDVASSGLLFLSSLHLKVYGTNAQEILKRE